MKTLWWQTVGTGNCHLVLLHGWGLNAEVWRCISENWPRNLRYTGGSAGVWPQPRLRRDDARGHGGAGSGSGAAKSRLARLELGGLVANQITLRHPERVQALITVASSPCFSAREAWPGIKPEVLAGFQHQLSEDFQRTVERFLGVADDGN